MCAAAARIPMLLLLLFWLMDTQTLQPYSAYLKVLIYALKSSKQLGTPNAKYQFKFIQQKNNNPHTVSLNKGIQNGLWRFAVKVQVCVQKYLNN